MSALRLLLLSVLALTSGCRDEALRPSTGSETHFLSWCSSDGSCEAGLACSCGVCTASCSGASSCSDLAAAAECVAADARPLAQSCSGAGLEASCEVSCNADVDCAPLGAVHRCDRGYCRQLAADCETGQVAGSDVVLLGDSFLAESHQVTAELEALARASGALAEGDQYRDYSSTLITAFGGSADLASQYATARDDGAMRIVVMAAGGPDVLLGTCPEPPTEECPTIQNAVAGADALWAQMAADGVEAVINFYYPYPPAATLQAELDILRPLLEAACSASPVSCHFVELQPTFEGHEAEYLNPSGLSPTPAGSVATAAVLWSAMQERCLAQ